MNSLAGPNHESRPNRADARPGPSTLGRYAVLETLGRGGMGEVLRAYDPRLLREVALKIVRTDGMDDGHHLRLLREAQAMGKLSHPNVVAVFDVEDSAVGVVVVMELVRGQTLRHWELAAPRPWSQVLAYYLAAGRGLAAAHAHGLIHRDFKASNVLLGDANREMPKVADFGLAKLQGHADTRPSQPSVPVCETSALDVSVTRADAIIGTPRSMAPEQHADHPLTPAVDQFGFCAALWQALTGEPPFAGDDLLRAKLEHIPVWPGTAPRVPRRIVAALLRGMLPRPASRWPSVDALLAELHRARARTPYRVVSVAGAAAVAVVGVGTFSNPSDARPCTGARQQLESVWNPERRNGLRSAIAAVDLVYAADTAQRAADGLDAYADRWTAIHTEACEATAVRGEQSPAMLDLRMACLARIKLDLDAAAATLAAANPEVVESAVDVVQGLPSLARCSDVEALAQDVAPPTAEQADAVHAAEVHLARSIAHRNAASFVQAQTALEAAERAVEGVDYPPIHINLALHRGAVLSSRADYEGAERALERVVRDGAAAGLWNLVGAASRNLVNVLSDGLVVDKEAMRYVAIAEGFATTDREVGELRRLAAYSLENLGRHDEAEAHAREALARYQRALDPMDGAIAATHSALAFVLSQQGRYEESLVHAEAALAVTSRAEGARHPSVARHHGNLATVLRHLERLEEAESHARTAHEIQRVIDPRGPSDAAFRYTLASILHQRGDYEGSIELRRTVLSDEIARVGNDHPSVATTRVGLGATLLDSGRPTEAAAEFRTAIETLTASVGPMHRTTVLARFNLTLAMGPQDHWDEAEAQLRTSVTDHIAAFGSDNPQVALPRVALARGLLTQGRAQEAVAFAAQAWQVHQSETTAPKQRAATAFVLARALWDSAAAQHDPHGPRTRARELAQLASQIYTERDPDKASDVRQWLAAHRQP